MDRQSLIFASVFPVPSLSHTTPTPIATPDLGYTAPGQPFGGPPASYVSGQHRAVRRNLAWSTATRFLSLPKHPLGSNASFDAPKAPRNIEVEEALVYILTGEGKSEDKHEESLVDWYTSEARLHFANIVRPALKQLWKKVIRASRYGQRAAANLCRRKSNWHALGRSWRRHSECYFMHRTFTYRSSTIIYYLSSTPTIVHLPLYALVSLPRSLTPMERMR